MLLEMYFQDNDLDKYNFVWSFGNTIKYWIQQKSNPTTFILKICRDFAKTENYYLEGTFLVNFNKMHLTILNFKVAFSTTFNVPQGKKKF